jgi:hypothetical protein
MLEAVEKRAYELILAAQNALWVLERQVDPSEPEKDCSGHDDRPLGHLSPTSKAGEGEGPSEVEDPVDVALREKRREIWEKIWTRLARYCAPANSRYYQERIKVIYACVRRAIYTEPTLMLVTQNYVTVTSLLKDSTLDPPTVEKFWKAIKGLSVHDLRAAVDDVLKPWSDAAEYVVVLNARVYKSLSCDPLPFHAWGHMASIFLCYSCIRRSCQSVSTPCLLLST